MKKALLAISAVLVGIGLFIGGFFFGRVNTQMAQPGWMMGNWNNQVSPEMMNGGEDQFGPGMMNNGQHNSEMMGRGQFGSGMMSGGQYGNMMGMMMGGQYGSGMMGDFSDSSNVDPLSVEDVETAVTDYLVTLNNDNLALGEIMIFDNHAYAQIIDETTETGAFEVLVDPVTGNIFSEPGPNMMWNTEYGMMSGQNSGMMGGQQSGMMGGYGYAPDAEITVTAEDAVDAAQEYLDAYLPGKTADEHADTFPGYYTLHVLEDGGTIGMLSVNAYTGQVFLHHWHGDLIEMAGEGHD